MVTNLEELKERIDIIEVLSKYLPLRKSGVNYTCNCPFHQERSPSFIISPQKQIYHCFGCGASGDAIKFLQEYKKLSFEEALEEIANDVNFTLIKTQAKPQYKGYEALKSLNDVFKEHLRGKENEKIMQYLFNRGLELEDLESFDIGLCPNTLPTEYKKELVELAIMYENNKSPFSNRITFGLRNATHKIVGFSARIHPYVNFANTAKYINSKESRIFNKSQILYNLSKARSEIVKQKSVYVVEGFMDCIALYKMGVRNCVATCGTAFNTHHLSNINRLKEDIHINLCFDNDEAGLMASKRALELLINQGFFNCSLSFLSGGFKDIGEILQKKAELQFKNIDGFSYFCLNGIKTAQTPKEKEQHINKIKAIIARQSNFYLKEELIAKAIDTLNLSPSFFIQSSKNNKNTSLEQSLLKTLLLDESLIEITLNCLDNEDLGEYAQDYESFVFKKVLTQKARDILLDESISTIPFAKFKHCVLELKRRYYKLQIEKAKAKRDIDSLILYTTKMHEFF